MLPFVVGLSCCPEQEAGHGPDPAALQACAPSRLRTLRALPSLQLHIRYPRLPPQEVLLVPCQSSAPWYQMVTLESFEARRQRQSPRPGLVGQWCRLEQEGKPVNRCLLQGVLHPWTWFAPSMCRKLPGRDVLHRQPSPGHCRPGAEHC